MITPGTYWTHKHPRYEVKVEPDEDLLTKDADGANWHPAIAFRRTDEEDSGRYVLAVADFLARFEASDA